MTAARSSPTAGRSRAVATWLALVGGSLGLHRFYLHGARDGWGWLYPWPTLLGALGFWRLREYGVDDALGSLLVLLLGTMLALSMLQAIVYGLTSDERWAATARAGAGGTRAGVADLRRGRSRACARRVVRDGDDRLRRAALLRVARRSQVKSTKLSA